MLGAREMAGDATCRHQQESRSGVQRGQALLSGSAFPFEFQILRQLGAL